MIYSYLVTVDTDTQEHADQVMAERTDYDEQYEDEDGVEFDYQFIDVNTVMWSAPDAVNVRYLASDLDAPGGPR